MVAELRVLGDQRQYGRDTKSFFIFSDSVVFMVFCLKKCCCFLIFMNIFEKVVFQKFYFQMFFMLKFFCFFKSFQFVSVFHFLIFFCVIFLFCVELKTHNKKQTKTTKTKTKKSGPRIVWELYIAHFLNFFEKRFFLYVFVFFLTKNILNFYIFCIFGNLSKSSKSSRSAVPNLLTGHF